MQMQLNSLAKPAKPNGKELIKSNITHGGLDKAAAP